VKVLDPELGWVGFDHASLDSVVVGQSMAEKTGILPYSVSDTIRHDRQSGHSIC